MEVYIGMDISLKDTHLCAVDGTGAIVHEGRTASDPHSLRTHILEYGKGWQIRKIGFETGQLSSHIYQGLRAGGLPAVCMDARHAHGVLKAQRVKTDKNDARGLAQLVRTGWYKAVHVKSSDGQALRTLLAARKQLVKLRQDMENHIRGTLKAYGVKLGVVTQGGFRQKVEEAVSAQDPLVRQATGALLEARQSLLGREKELDKSCKKLAGTDAVCKRLTSIPGVGVITALAYKAEIDDPTRFKHSRDVGVHLGLTPRRYASGEIDRAGRISKCGNNALRSLLFEAAFVMLTRSKKWSRLKHWGIQIAKRSSVKTAAAAVARKLAIVMHRLWIDNTEFAYAAPEAA